MIYDLNADVSHKYILIYDLKLIQIANWFKYLQPCFWVYTWGQSIEWVIQWDLRISAYWVQDGSLR